MKYVRLAHMYLGVFLAPSLIFFALSGALQTFRLNDASRATGYRPPAWVAAISQLHKNQDVPLQSARPAANSAAAPSPGINNAARAQQSPAQTHPEAHSDARPGPNPKTSAPSAAAHRPSPLPMKIFFVFVSLGLAVSTVLGLYMSFKFNRNKRIIGGLLAAGIVVPILLLFI